MKGVIGWILVFGLKSFLASGASQTRSTILDNISPDKCQGLPQRFFDLLPVFSCPDGPCKYICQKNEIPNHGYYVSLYSTKYKMSVFSAAVIEDTYEAKGPRDNTWEDDTIPLLKPFQTGSMKHFEAFSEYHRGHLFPYRFAASDKQGLATNRLTNAVPQDSSFNKGAWSAAENHLKKYIDDCHKQDNFEAILITGAVPAYFGKGQDKKELRMAKTSNNYPLARPTAKEGDLADGLTVPTHMWTQFFCIKTSNTKLIRSQVSLIGLNHKSGVVRLYENGITRTLTEMYKNSLGYTAQKLTQDLEKKKSLYKGEHSGNLKLCKADTTLNMNLECKGQSGPIIDDKFWESVNVKVLRRNWLTYMLEQNHGGWLRDYAWKMLERKRMIKESAVLEADPKKKKIAESGQGGDQMEVQKSLRRRRSVGATPEEETVSRYAVSIIDNDPESDFEVETCKILEKSKDGQVIETHTYDFKKDILFQDGKVSSGSTLTANFTEDGVEQQAQVKPTQDETITIVLRPR